MKVWLALSETWLDRIIIIFLIGSLFLPLNWHLWTVFQCLIAKHAKVFGHLCQMFFILVSLKRLYRAREDLSENSDLGGKSVWDSDKSYFFNVLVVLFMNNSISWQRTGHFNTIFSLIKHRNIPGKVSQTIPLFYKKIFLLKLTMESTFVYPQIGSIFSPTVHNNRIAGISEIYMVL